MPHKILVVDDDEFIREVLREMISGYEVIEAESGLRAIELYDKEHPDLILMDVVMPVMDGIEATKIISGRNPEVIIIGVTAFSATKGEDMIRAGAKEVMSKPVKMNDLRNKVKKYLSLLDAHKNVMVKSPDSRI